LKGGVVNKDLSCQKLQEGKGGGDVNNGAASRRSQLDEEPADKRKEVGGTVTRGKVFEKIRYQIFGRT